MMCTSFAANQSIAACVSAVVAVVARNSSAPGAMSLTISATATPCGSPIDELICPPTHRPSIRSGQNWCAASGTGPFSVGFHTVRSKKSMMPTRVAPVMPACCHRCALVSCTSSPTSVPVPTASSRGSRLMRSGCCTYCTASLTESWSTAPAGIRACTRWPSTEPVTVPPRSLIARSTAGLSVVRTSIETNGSARPSPAGDRSIDLDTKLRICTRANGMPW
jgi:hypothetical protein